MLSRLKGIFSGAKKAAEVAVADRHRGNVFLAQDKLDEDAVSYRQAIAAAGTDFTDLRRAPFCAALRNGLAWHVAEMV